MAKRNNIRGRKLHSFKGFGPWSLGSLLLELWRIKMSWEGPCDRQNKGHRGKGVSLRTYYLQLEPISHLYQLPVIRRVYQWVDLYDEVKPSWSDYPRCTTNQTSPQSLWIFESTTIKWNLCKGCKNYSTYVNQYIWNTSQHNKDQILYNIFYITKNIEQSFIFFQN